MPEWLIFVIGQVCVGIGVYGGIRADLREALTLARNAEKSSTAAHDRIDDLILGKRG
jgi:hypothetical protein